MRSLGKLWILVGAVFAVPAAATEAVTPKAVLRPLKTDRPPVIDGRLDDPVWAEAPSVTDFKTFIPDFGKDQPENTVSYMAYDSENLYFAFRCFDDQPDKIKAAVSRRDDVQADDFVCINLDSFNDQQSLYAFYVNPLGIQGDSRFASNREDFSVDMVWYSAGRIDEQGYSVEMRIPLKSIRYASGQRVEMGIFFERFISRRSEHGSYPELDPKRGYAFLTQMAPLEFFGLKRYTLLELLPAFTYSQKYFQSGGRLKRDKAARDISLTGKYGIRSSLILDGTYNPDFSQVEADAGQVDVNLRYDLFFPEKRPFFLEGSENFNIGATTYSSIQTLVHTRTIIDPKAGFKLTGKIGRKDTVASVFAVDESPSTGESGDADVRDAYFSIFRYKRTMSQDGYLGISYTGRDQGGGFNRVIGPDGQIRLSQSAMLSFHAFGSFTRPGENAPRADGHALGIEYRHDTSKLGLTFSAQDISADFEAQAGYLTRTGLSKAEIHVTPKIYPRSSWFRRLDPLLVTSALKDHESGLYETMNAVGLTAVLKGNSVISTSYDYSTEIFLGRSFRAGGFLINGRSQLTKQLTVRLTFRKGKAIRYSADPFQGQGSRATASLVYQPSENLNLTLNMTYADLFRDSNSEKIYDYMIYRSRLIYQVNKYLFFRGIAEYNSFRGQLLTDFLASFTYIPGTVLHVGYGSLYKKLAWEEGMYRESSRFLETGRGFFFKASYLWRL